MNQVGTKGELFAHATGKLARRPLRKGREAGHL